MSERSLIVGDESGVLCKRNNPTSMGGKTAMTKGEQRLKMMIHNKKAIGYTSAAPLVLTFFHTLMTFLQLAEPAETSLWERIFGFY